MINRLGAYGLVLVLMTALTAGCTEATDGDGDSNTQGEFDFFGGSSSDGKGDFSSRAHIVDEIALRSKVKGKFVPGRRVLGYRFEAKAGAVVAGHVKAVGGSDSVDAAGEELEMIMGIYAMDGDKPGERLAYVDQSDAGAEALDSVKIEQDGDYMFVFSTWADAANGTYEVDLGCSGTDFQCLRPVNDKPCEAQPLYVQGDFRIDKDTTWNACEVVLLETTTVEEGAILTIEPGVVVKGNYLGQGTYGEVSLHIEGKLQARGSAKHPVVFSAFKDGWQGLRLKGDSNTLEQVFIEKAARGVEIDGSKNNTLRHVNVNSSQVAIAIINEGQAQLEDIILTGIEGATPVGEGILGHSGSPSEFNRSIVRGFETGIHLTSSEFKFVDSTITGNKRGVYVTGEDAGIVNYPFTCPALPTGTSAPSRTAIWTPSPIRRDPYFQRCDLINNTDEAIFVNAPELLIVEQSNVRGNGKGIVINSTALHPESRINQSNLYDNGDGAQVDAWHVSGVLDISDNYWKHISDPELSASWLVSHQHPHTCSGVVNSASNVSNQNGYTCNRGNYNSRTRQYAYTCNQTIQASWEGEVNFRGFSPVELEAGPQVSNLTEPIKEVRQQSGL